MYTITQFTLLLLKRDKSLTSSTSLTVIHGSVCNGELTEVLSNHLGLDLYGNVLLSVVHSDDTTDHLRKNDDITKMSLDGGGLLLDSVVSDLGTVDGLLDLVHQSDLLGLDTVSEFSTNSGSQMRKKLLVLLVHAHLHELVQLETAEAEFLEYTTFTGTGLCVCVFVSGESRSRCDVRKRRRILRKISLKNNTYSYLIDACDHREEPLNTIPNNVMFD